MTIVSSELCGGGRVCYDPWTGTAARLTVADGGGANHDLDRQLFLTGALAYNL